MKHLVFTAFVLALFGCNRWQEKKLSELEKPWVIVSKYQYDASAMYVTVRGVNGKEFTMVHGKGRHYYTHFNVGDTIK